MRFSVTATSFFSIYFGLVSPPLYSPRFPPTHFYPHHFPPYPPVVGISLLPSSSSIFSLGKTQPSLLPILLPHLFLNCRDFIFLITSTPIRPSCPKVELLPIRWSTHQHIEDVRAVIRVAFATFTRGQSSSTRSWPPHNTHPPSPTFLISFRTHAGPSPPTPDSDMAPEVHRGLASGPSPSGRVLRPAPGGMTSQRSRLLGVAAGSAKARGHDALRTADSSQSSGSIDDHVSLACPTSAQPCRGPWNRARSA